MRFFVWILLTGIILSPSHATTLTLVTLESPPAEFTQNGKSTGRNVEIAQEALSRMGFDSIVKIIPWKRALIMVETGIADAIIDAAYTPERAEAFYYPDEEIYTEEWYVFKRIEDPLTFDRDLGNVGQYTLGISRGFEYGGIIQEAINNNRFKKTQMVVNNEMNIKKLVGKRFDVFVGVKLTIFHLARQMGHADKIQLVPMTETGEPYLMSSSKTYVAFSKKTMTREMAEQFSTILRQMKEDGIVKKIEAKYY